MVEETSITQVISASRRVLGEARGDNRYIATVPGRGYRFVAEVAYGPATEATPTRYELTHLATGDCRCRLLFASAAVVGIAALAIYLMSSPDTQPRSRIHSTRP